MKRKKGLKLKNKTNFKIEKGENMKKEYIYEIQWLNSGLLKNIKTSMPFNENDFVIIEQANEYDGNSMLFIGKVMRERSKGEFNRGFEIIQRIDLSDYMEEIRKKQKREELEIKLITEVKNYDPLEIAKILSKTNETFRKLYEEYKRLC